MVRKRICFVSARPGFLLSDRSFMIQWADGRLIEKLAEDGLISSVAFFHDPVNNASYNFRIVTNRIYRLPFPFSYKGGMLNFLKVFRQLKAIENDHDIIIVQLPIASFLPLLFLRKPVIYHVCANVLTASANPFKYQGVKRLLSTSFARLMHWSFKRLFFGKRNGLIVNGNELGFLYRRFSPKIVVSSSIYESEIVSSESLTKREGKEFRILFVGRPSMEKGIDILLRAFKSMIDRCLLVNLVMVGVSKHELLANLVDFEVEEKYLDRISFNGFVPWGSEFKDIVQGCHCLTMCSVSEGTPRVIVEAMALGCPVIATNVGGVSTVVANYVNGILVPPGDSDELSRAINELVENEKLRQQLALSALIRVRDFTLEKFSSSFRGEIGNIEKKFSYGIKTFCK